MCAFSHCNRRDCVLEDELVLVVRLQNNRILIERPDSPRQLDPAHQINGDAAPLLARRVQECVLYILCRRLVFHRRSPVTKPELWLRPRSQAICTSLVRYGVIQEFSTGAAYRTVSTRF